jgi:hypothetical protein
MKRSVFTSHAFPHTPYVRRMGRRTEVPSASGSSVEEAAEAAGGGSRAPSLSSAMRWRRRPRLRTSVWTTAPSSSAAPHLAGGLRHIHLRDGGGCVQRRARRDEERTCSGGCIAGVGATARVWCMGRLRDGGGGSGGGWNGVGRGCWGAEGRVHRRDCAGSRAETRDWAVGRLGAGGSFSAGFLRACGER